MANIILYTDFVGKINLPNTLPGKSEGDALASFITDNEATYLTEVLGYTMAAAFIAAIGTTPAPTSGVWYDLWKGADFTDKHGRANHWPGFRNAVQKLAIANYIYVKWLEDRQDYATGVGQKKAKSENAEDASPTRKICRAWNEMVDLNYILDDFLTQNAADYPDYIGITGPVLSGYFDTIYWNSLTDYGNRIFYTKRNIFGL
jgi:hypothetical protein